MRSILVSDYMNHQPTLILHTANIRDAVILMLSKKIIGVSVVDENRNLVGYISEQDCIAQMLNVVFHSEEPGPVHEVMARDVMKVTPETTVVELAETIIKSRPKNYPVIDEDGKLVGLISRTEVLQALIDKSIESYHK
ncbi:MAG: CBS domain-containing protein [Cellvibrionaceae bacterium]|jgi:CBS domain-containing protein